MEDNNSLVLIGICCLFGGLLIWWLVYSIIGMLKGKIVITVNGLEKGEENILTGTVVLLTRQAAKSENFGIYLIGEELYTSHDGKQSTREAFRRFELLEPGKEYSAGEENTYNFKIVIPKNIRDGISEGMQNSKTGNDKLDGLLGVAGGLLNTYNKFAINDIKWHLRAELNLPGVDITETKKIYI